MSRVAGAPAGPLSGWTVLVVCEKFFASSTTPARLRALGARIVRKPNRALTHVAAPFEDEGVNATAIGELFLQPKARQALEAARAFVAANAISVAFVGPEALLKAVQSEEDILKARHADLERDRQTRVMAALRLERPIGFVGI